MTSSRWMRTVVCAFYRALSALNVIVYDSISNASGHRIGPYTIEFSSTRTAAPPATALVALAGSNNAQIPVASWYQIWIQDLSGLVLFQTYYTEQSADCSGGSGTCSIILPVQINGSVRIWVRPWSDSGGYGFWSSLLEFSTVAGAPAASTPVAPVDGTLPSATPLYEWSRVSNATWYYIWADDVTGGKLRKWVTAGQANCAQPSESCRYRSPTGVQGAMSWWVRSWNSDSFGPWSGRADFNSPW